MPGNNRGGEVRDWRLMSYPHGYWVVSAPIVRKFTSLRAVPLP